MGFTEKFKEKLHLKDALTIRKVALKTDKISNKCFDLLYIILHKIMMSDGKSRSSLFENHNSSNEINGDDNSHDEEIYDTEKRFHPIDCIITLLLSCDDLLRQDLINKLLSCQLAVPLILPNPNENSLIFLLWGLRSVVHSWKSHKHGEMEKRMVDYKGPIVAFIRVGEVGAASKSELLNEVIGGESKQFFCWNFEGGNVKRQFVDGLIELCWYLPACKENVPDVFPDAVAFINLRGDAQNHPKQLEFVQKISYLTVILAEENSINRKNLKIFENLAKTAGGIVLLPFNGKIKSTKLHNLQKKLTKQKLIRIMLKDKNRANIIKTIQQTIAKKIDQNMKHDFKSISSFANSAKQIGIEVDESCENSSEGKALATKVMDEIEKNEDASKIKEMMLPLQGPDLWHKWAEYDKERNRHKKKKDTNITMYNSELDDHKNAIRLAQLSISLTYTPLFKLFIESLTKSKPLIRTYYLQWLKIFLDDHSREILPNLHAQYQKTREKYLKEKEKEKPDSNELQTLQNELKLQNKKLVEATFGLEHLFREMAQLYEARMDPSQRHISNDLKNEVSKFPHIMSEIMEDGHSLELMDGDASHVPITWVKAVLQCLKQNCKSTSKLFVLSILGIQSTGKSTLLNTLFGLRFNVSAGRCTRGAFIQIIPLDSELKKHTSCDKVLVIDTEGLRAPELQLEDLDHDNELATFVIGLADSTMINIFGEVPGDLNDILQTSIHAFIRMRKVEMNPSCMFVHQNVTAIMSKNKTLVGRQNFQNKLDIMTVAAAKVEQCDHHYKQFRDVIHFNDQSDIFHFPSLWKGDPPMAPVNPGYSETAQILKVSFTNLIKTKRECRSTFEEFDFRISNVWLAVLQENFVFSFKNTLEVSAYNELDAQYGKWSWGLQNAMLEWQQKTKTKIESFDCIQVDNNKNDETKGEEEDKIKLKLKAKPEKNKTNIIADSRTKDDTKDKTNNRNAPDIHSFANACIAEAETIIDTIYVDLIDKMNSFIDTSDFMQTLTKWKHSTERRLQDLSDEHRANAKRFCRNLVLNKLNYAELEKLQNNQLDIIQVHIKELVTTSWAEGKELSNTEI